MSDTLDIINTVRLNDLSITGSNRDLQYDLDRRADRLAAKTGTRPMDWDEFNTANIAAKEAGVFDHALDWGWKGAVLGALAMLVFSAFEIATVGIGTGVAAGAAIGFLGASTLSLFDDQKPEIRQTQLGKYKAYLDDFERGHSQSVARAPEVAHEAETTQWRDQVSQSKAAAQGVALQNG